MKISYSFGMMDLFHYGHVKSLAQAKQNADIHIFGLVSDEASDAWFGGHVSNEKERIEVTKSIKFIDEIMIQKTFDPLENLKNIHARYPEATITLYHGNEWGILSSKNFLKSIGGNAVKLDYYEKLSPTNILKTLNENSINQSLPNNDLISTKANTLFALKDLLKKSKIEKMVIVTIEDYKNNVDDVLTTIQKELGNSKKIIVRSSSKREDAFEESNAGHFESVLNVNPNNRKDVIKALSKVIWSYGNCSDDEQILIQQQTEHVLYSGVVFTRDILKNRPYYVINYDDSGDTSAVTSGSSYAKSIWITHSLDIMNLPSNWKKLMTSIKELEELLPGILLDIEFAITEQEVVIFQVRPLAAAYKFGRNNMDLEIKKAHEKALKKYSILSNTGHICFSDMAFWNPSEIIGDNPHQLDYSLYREIVTKSTYNDALLEMGYSKTNDELMYRFMNKPYINLENSFITLTPSDLSNNIRDRLLSFYLSKFSKDITSHDKIEFEICYNCYDFKTSSRIEELYDNGFNKDEVSMVLDSLKSITINNILHYKELLSKDLNSLEQLEIVRKSIENNGKSNDYIYISKSIKTLVESIKKYGTPQFTRQARCAFIAKSLIKSLYENKEITQTEYNAFLSSINTIAIDYNKDFKDVVNGLMDKKSFLSLYGHLRAGTYNIRSPRYDEMDKLFDDSTVLDSYKNNHINKTFNFVIEKAFRRSLEKENISDVDEKTIVEFIRLSTEQREYFKFMFTKSLSLILSLIKKMGEILGVSIDDLSYLELPEIYSAEYYSKPYRLKEFWKLIIEERKHIYHINSLPILPSVITSKNDFELIEMKEVRANFVGDSVTSGELAILLEDNMEIDLNNKIVVIEKADPGFDYIFTQNIKGLITKYGGAASHMAIRCAEFNIPAAIGCGTLLFDYVIKSKRIKIDAKHDKIIRE